MFKLDNAFLEELGLGALPPAEKNRMLAHIYETLEMRVGMRLAEQMTNQQLDEFEAYISQKDEAGALKWLETNFPNYKQVVAEELEKLKNEVRQVAPQIVAQAATAAQQAPAAVPAPTTPQVNPPQPPQQYQQPTSPQPPVNPGYAEPQVQPMQAPDSQQQPQQPPSSQPWQPQQ